MAEWGNAPGFQSRIDGRSSVRAGVGTFSIVLAIVLLLMVGGLMVADEAVRRAGYAQAHIDANESAVMLQQVLDGQIEELEDFGLLDSAVPPHIPLGRVSVMAAMFAAERPMLRRVWVTDTTGRPIFDSTLVAPRDPRTVASRAAALDAAAEVARSGRPAVDLGGEAASREVTIATPLRYQGRVVGVSGAVFEARALFAPVLHLETDTRSYLAIVGASDTIVSLGNRPAPPALATATVRVPSGARWTIAVSHIEPAQNLRVTLWALGLVAVGFLSLGVFRERRQARRISERSAELERLSTELLRANRMKSEFLANVSHELRTPLNAIVGFVDLLRDGVYGDLTPRQMPPVDRIAASASHLRHLVDQVLDIAKIAAGRLEIHAETVMLRPFVLNVASELESLISERGLTLSIAIGASLPRVRTDPTHLRQILVNLIGNAVKYTPSGGVAVRARLVGATRRVAGRRLSPEDPTLIAQAPDPRRAWIALQVIDTGIGIAPADQERIFDEFEQVNAGPRGESMQRGTGLGLAISRRLARLLGGDISVDSHPGKGSTFTLWLPVSAADLEQEPAPPEAMTRAAPTSVPSASI